MVLWATFRSLARETIFEAGYTREGLMDVSWRVSIVEKDQGASGEASGSSMLDKLATLASLDTASTTRLRLSCGSTVEIVGLSSALRGCCRGEVWHVHLLRLQL